MVVTRSCMIAIIKASGLCHCSSTSKCRDNLHASKGPLSHFIGSNTIAMANKEVERKIAEKKKCGHYRRLTFVV